MTSVGLVSHTTTVSRVQLICLYILRICAWNYNDHEKFGHRSQLLLQFGGTNETLETLAIGCTDTDAPDVYPCNVSTRRRRATSYEFTCQGQRREELSKHFMSFSNRLCSANVNLPICGRIMLIYSRRCCREPQVRCHCHATM